MRFLLIYRFLFKDAAASFLAVFSVLSLIMIGGVFVRMLGRVARGAIDAELLLPFLTWGTLQSLSTLVAVSMFLGMLFSLGRMYKSNEIYALRAAGVGDLQLMTPYLWLGALVALGLLTMTFWVQPLAEQKIKLLRAEAVHKMNLAGIRPGKFVTFPGSSRVVFAERSGAHKDQLARIFLFEELPQDIRVVAAEKATQMTVDELHGDYLELSAGRLFQGRPDGRRFTRGVFDRMGFRLPSVETGPLAADVDMMPVSALLAVGSPRHMAEFHWRISFPVSIGVLVLLAVALSYSGPRQGRFGSLGIAILVYLLYANLLGLGKDMIEKGSAPSWLGLWWVHLIFVLLAVVILLRQNRFWERLSVGRSGRGRAAQGLS